MSSAEGITPTGGVYDVTVFGATGFVGHLCIRHLVDHPEFSSRLFTWAIAGRSASKLSTLKQKYSLPADVGILEADTSRPEDGRLERMVKSSRVVINLVGPYSDYGSFHLAELCAQNGVSYTDLSGESLFNKNLVEKLHDVAKKTGAALVPSVGYDSLPADLSVYLGARRILEKAKEKGQKIGHIEAIAGGSVNGAASGGTIETWRSMVSGPDPWQMLWEKPTAIADSLYQSTSTARPTSKMHNPFALWLPQFGGYGATNPLGLHNARAVYHTAALLSVEEDGDDRKTKYTPTFQFVDLLVNVPKVPAFISYILAIIASSSIQIISLLMANSALFRKLSAKVIPVGTGPSEKLQKAGFVKMSTLVAGWKSVEDVTGDHPKMPIAASAARWTALNADPGYLMTSRVTCEVSLLIAYDRKSGKNQVLSGVRTGATLLKNPKPLVERLEKYAQIKIGVEDWDAERRGIFKSLTPTSEAGASSSSVSQVPKSPAALPMSLPTDPTDSSPYPHCPAGFLPLSETGGDIIQITYDPLDIAKMTDHVTSRWAGAVVAFLGMTRDDRTVGKGPEEGRTLSVSCLEYEAYTPLALATMGSVVARAKSCPPDQWPPPPPCPEEKDRIKQSLAKVVLISPSDAHTSAANEFPIPEDSSSSPPSHPLSLVRVALIHRVGPVSLKESSILILVSSPHRRRAFQAAEWILEEVKREVPVWKREVRVRANDGDGQGGMVEEDGEGWVGLREAERHVGAYRV